VEGHEDCCDAGGGKGESDGRAHRLSEGERRQLGLPPRFALRMRCTEYWWARGMRWFILFEESFTRNINTVNRSLNAHAVLFC
jgi:hypothetical protein